MATVHQTRADISAYLAEQDRARARRLEAFAIEALELGIAFEEAGLEPEDPVPADEDESSARDA